jgi:gluconolactonase
VSRIETLATALAFPEGPAVAPDGAIWFSELKSGQIACLADGGLTRFAVGDAPNGIALATDGMIWFCDQGRNQVRRLDPASGATSAVFETVDGEPLAAPNDLAFHPDGSLIVSCPGNSRVDPTGYLCRWTPGGRAERICDGLLFPNGLCFSADGTTLYFAETYGLRVMAAAWAAQLAPCPLFATPGPIGADGVAVTGDGAVWATVYGAPLLRRFDPVTGATDDFALPDAHPAGCAADPHGRWDVIVTGTETGVLLGVTR